MVVVNDILGMSLLFFCGIWVLLGLNKTVKRYPEDRIAGVLIVIIALIVVGCFVYLVASTTTRRAFINLEMRELITALVQDTAGFILGGTAAVLIYGLAQRLKMNSSIRFGILSTLGIVLYSAAIMGWLYTTTFSPDLDEVFTEAARPEEVTVVGNLPVRITENTVTEAPTALEVGPHNELYVASISGYIWVMLDDEQDGVADTVIEFASGLRQPEGLAWSDNGLYVTVIDKLLLLTDTDGDYKADETEVIVEGFPGEVYAFHQSSGLTFGPDGRLYIGVGSTTDHRAETHPLAARILSVNPDGSDLQVYATGVRNPFGIVPAPGGGFFAVDNGSSGCIDTEVQIDDCSNPIDVPEEVNYITEGNNYGFPDFFGIPPQDSGTIPPLLTFPDHSVPAGIVIYEGDRLPEKYKNQLFVSLWARNEIYVIRLFRIDDEHFTGSSRLFASGILGPSAMVNSPGGGLYVASFTGNAIYHIG